MDLDKAIKTRHSVRRFKEKKPDWRAIMKAIESAIHAPLAGNIQTLKVIVVSDEDKIQKLAQAAQQDFIASAHYVVVICSEDAKAVRSYDERGKKYCRQQAGAAIQNFLLKITELGLGTCWIGAFSDESVRNILQIPDNVEIEAMFPIGYEMGKAKQRLKPELDETLYFEHWKQCYATNIRKPEAM